MNHKPGSSQHSFSAAKADRAMTLIFMIAREGRMGARLGRQIRRRRSNRLDAGLLVRR
jgi:hypothetical protein